MVPGQTVMLGFDRLRVDGAISHPKWDPLLRVVAAFTIASGETPIYSEPDFPVVEFGVQLARWLSRVRAGEVTDFSYTSLESDEPEWIWFRQVEDGGWSVGARYEETADRQTHSLGSLLAASEHYISTLALSVREQLGVEIEPLLRPSG